MRIPAWRVLTVEASELGVRGPLLRGSFLLVRDRKHVRGLLATDHTLEIRARRGQCAAANNAHCLPDLTVQ